MVDRLTEKRIREIREDISCLLGIDIIKIQISENKEIGFYLKVDTSERRLSVVVVFRTILHFIAELEHHKPMSVLIKANEPVP